MRLLPVFVYGTLKPGQTAYKRLLSGKTTDEQPAVIPGAALYTDGTYPYLVVDPEVVALHDEVRGMLIALHPESFEVTLALLDRYEDYRPLSPWRLFERVVLTARTEHGTIEAWAYTAGPQALQAIRAGRMQKIPGGVWPPQSI